MCFLWCQYWKKSLLRLGYRRLWLPSSCHPHSLTLSDEGICHVVSCPMERSAWQGTDQKLMKNQTLLIITCVNLGASSGKPEMVAVLLGTLIGALWETQSQRKQPSFLTHRNRCSNRYLVHWESNSSIPGSRNIGNPSGIGRPWLWKEQLQDSWKKEQEAESLVMALRPWGGA